MSKFKTVFFAALALCLVFGGIIGWRNSAQAATGAEDCVPAAAYTEFIEHPAVTHQEDITVVDEEAWTETVPGTPEVWANWSPNHQEGPFEGPPAFPDDPRGTWQLHDKIPGGHEGPDGVYQRDHPGQGNADWFYRANGVADTFIEHPEVSHLEEITVTDEEAWTEEIDHPEVVCDDPDPSEDPEPTDDPSTEPEPEPEPASRVLTECISQTEIKVTLQLNEGEGWEDESVSFLPARPIDHCKVATPQMTDTEVDEAVTSTYSSEEGM